MLKRIQLLHYRGFEDLQASVADTTVLMGANSSGKTTVLHAIRLACESLLQVAHDPDSSPDIGADGWIAACWRAVVPDPNTLVSLSDWTQVFRGAHVHDRTSLSIRLHFEPKDSIQELYLELAYGRNRQLLRTVQLKSSAAASAVQGLARKARGRRERLREELMRLAPLVVFVPAFYGVTRTEEYRTQPLINRLLGGGDQSHIVRNLVARLDAGALTRLNNRILAPLRTEVTYRTAQADADQHADLSVYYKDDNGELELASAGAGLINLVALFAAMERLQEQRRQRENRPVIFLVDELEAHLHPRLQGDAAEALANLAVREFGIQLVLATHSVEVINRLGRRDEAILLHVDRRAAPSVTELRSESETIEALETFCDLTPFTSLSFLASRRVLFYEGPSDQRILDACARIAFRSIPDQHQRWREYTLVPLHGVGNVSARGMLQAVLTPQLFPKLDKQRPVRAGLVRDRDWNRDPAPPRRTQVAPHFEAVEVVWSRHSIENLFLEPDCLTAWLEPSLGVDAATLRPLIVAAIAAADKDPALEDEARDGRYPFHRRADPDHRMLDEKAASRRTREEVRGNPAAFQQGHNRANFVLNHLRQALPAKIRQRLRGQLAEVIASAPIDSIKDPDVALPGEVRALLDLLVAP